MGLRQVEGTTNITSPGDTTGDSAYCNVVQVSTWYIGHGYQHETGNTQMQMNYGNSGALVFEYNYVYKNHTAKNSKPRRGVLLNFLSFYDSL